MITFGPDNEDSYFHLNKKVATIFIEEPTSNSLTKLQQLLNKFKPDFLRLTFLPPNNEDKQKVETNQVKVKGIAVQLPQNVKDIVFQLSQVLNLNEIACVNLILSAAKSNQLIRFGIKEYRLAIKLFYDDYLNLLTSLLSLMQVRENEEINQQFKDLVINFTNELLKENIITNMCDLILKLNKNISQYKDQINNFINQGNNESPRIPEYEDQISFTILIRRKIAEILFFASFNLQTNPDTINKIYDTILQCNNLFNNALEEADTIQWTTTETNINNEEFIPHNTLSLIDKLDRGSKSIYSVLYLLTATILCLLDPSTDKERIDPYNNSRTKTNTLYRKQQFLESFDNKLGELLDTVEQQGSTIRPQFESIISLMWSIGLETHTREIEERAAEWFKTRSELAFERSLRVDVFEFMAKGLLNSKMFRNEDEQTKEFLVFVFSELLCNMITTLKDLIDRLLAMQSERLREYINLREDGHVNLEEDEEEISKYFNHLLLLTAELYREFPFYSHNFWDREDHYPLYEFITKTCCEHIATLCKIQNEIDIGFIYYIGVLCSFSGDNEGATFVYYMLRDSPHQMFCWDYLFLDLLAQFQQRYQQQPQSQQYVVNIDVPDEKTLDAVYVVLRLIENVSSQSEECRKLFLENPQWDILTTLFGMMFVPSVTPILMGQVFTTLSSFVRRTDNPEPSKEAIQILTQLDRTQILKYEMVNDDYKISGGIKYQLEQKETQEGEYYETRGFLELLDALIGCTSKPVSGFLPYLKFIQVDVFNNINKRYYKDPSEKWLVAKACLQIIFRLLNRYTPNPTDFTAPITRMEDEDNRKNTPVSNVMEKPPGFQLMSDMLRENLFRQELFRIIDSDVRLEVERVNNPEGDALEKTYLLILEIIETVLQKEESFLNCSISKTATIPLVIKPLETQLGNSIIIKIARLMEYPHNTEMRYRATNILSLISKNRDKLVSLFKEKHEDKRLINIIVRNLRSIETEHVKEQNDFEEKVLDEDQMDNETRLIILEMLKNNVDAPEEGLTHLLCGFDISDNNETKEIDLFGERNCLTTILHLLKSKRLPKTHPRFIESCYELLYKLCANRRMTQQTFACLEKANFLIEKLKDSSFVTNIGVTPLAHHMLNQRAFVMKIVALKLYSNTRTTKKGDSNRGGVQELVSILFGGDLFSEDNFTPSFGNLEQRRALMLEVLDIIDLTISPPTKSPEEANKEWNLFLKISKSIHNAFSGWKQLVEITLSQCFSMITEDDTRKRILHDLINSLLFKLSQMTRRQTPSKQQHQLELLVAQTILRVISKLREELIMSGDTIILPTEQCINIFRNLLECTLQSTQSEQSTRGNLYASIVNYLQYTRCTEMNEHNVQLQELQKHNEYVLEKYDINLLRLVSADAMDAKNVWKAVSFSLLETVFLYSSSIHQHSRWLNLYEKENYLQQFLDTILMESKQTLPKVLVSSSSSDQDTTSLNHLFIYENAMSFLLRIADMDEMGSERLFQYNLIYKMATHFNFIDMRPSMISYQFGGGNGNQRNNGVAMEDEDDDDWQFTLVEKYNQLAIPAFKLVVAIQSKLRNNKKVAEHVVSFIESHKKAISDILKLSNIVIKSSLLSIDIGSLELLRLVSSMFYLLSPHLDVVSKKLSITKYENLLLNTLTKVSSIQQLGIRTQVINTLDVSTLSANTTTATLEGGKPNEELQLESELEQKRLCIDEICKNIIGYCRVVTQYSELINGGDGIISASLDTSCKRVLFTHSLSNKNIITTGSGSESNINHTPFITNNQLNKSSIESEQRPSLFSLCTLLNIELIRLKDVLEQRYHCETNLQQLGQLKIEKLNEMVRSANAIMGEEHIMSFFEHQDNPKETKALCYTILARKLLKLNHRLNTHINIMENILVVLWRHLNYFLQTTILENDELNDNLLPHQQQLLSNEQKKVLLQEASTGLLNKLLDEISHVKITPLTVIDKKTNTAINDSFLQFIAQHLKDQIFQSL
ncbi:hypothetical protein ABK040_009919 [Willaertia magna]